jgi:hypothetical protein
LRKKPITWGKKCHFKVHLPSFRKELLHGVLEKATSVGSLLICNYLTLICNWVDLEDTSQNFGGRLWKVKKKRHFIAYNFGICQTLFFHSVFPERAHPAPGSHFHKPMRQNLIITDFLIGISTCTN